MINVFEHTQPVLTTITNRINTARVSTLGLLDNENDEEKNKDKIKNQGLLIKKIKISLSNQLNFNFNKLILQ